MRKKILSFIALFLPLLGHAGPNPHDIVGRADEIMNKSGGYEYLLELEVMRNEETEVAYTMLSFFKGRDRMLIEFREPPRVRDQAILRNHEDQWIYFPKLKRTLKISSRSPLVGSDFSYGDILNLNLEEDYNAKLLNEKVQEGGSLCFQLELTAKRPTALYDKVTYFVRQSDYAPIKRQFFTKSGVKLKDLVFSDHDATGLPRLWTMSSVLSPGHVTLMRIKKIKQRLDLSDNDFTLASLRRR